MATHKAITIAELFELNVLENNQVKKLSYALTIPSGCNVDNLRIVVYVMRQNSGVYYIDNSATEKIGVEKNLGIKSDSWGGGNEGITPGDDIVLK